MKAFVIVLVVPLVDDDAGVVDARRRAETDYGITVDKLTDMLMDTYESSDTRPAGKLRAIMGLAKLHGFI